MNYDVEKSRKLRLDNSQKEFWDKVKLHWKEATTNTCY